MKKNNKGFTLVELIVVIAILGVLMAVLVPQYIQYVEKSKQGTDASAYGEVLHAVEIESALATTGTTTGTITVATDASGNVTIAGTATGLVDPVMAVIGDANDNTNAGLTTLDMKSNACKVIRTLTIEIDATTKQVSWATSSKTFLDNLTKGAAKSADTVS